MQDYSSALNKRIADWSEKTGKPYLVLGHDVGIASDGFCLLDLTNGRILEMGSRLFDAPQADKTKQSLAAVRRAKRSARRNTKRTRGRMKKCLVILKHHGLVPEDASASWLQLGKGETPTIWLRVKALDKPITNRELAQVLYTLCKRRGYIDHGRGGEASDKDEGAVLDALRRNGDEMAAESWRTVGEMLAQKGRNRNHAGNYELMVTNEQIQDEVRAICKAQRKLGNQLVTDEFVEEYVKCLTWQVSTYARDKSIYDRVGRCTYFPDLPRAARADPSNELCAALESYHHLVIVAGNGTERHLTKVQIDAFVKSLFSAGQSKSKSQRGLTYSKLRKALGLGSDESFKGVDRDDEDKREPYRPRGWLVLCSCYSDEALRALAGERHLADALCEALTYASSRESLEDRFEELLVALDVPAPADEIVEELVSKGPYGSKVFKSYGSRSLKALDLLIGALEEPSVATLTDAEAATGLDRLLRARREGQNRTESLIPFDAYCPDCRNPVVLRASSQVRKVTNAIIKRYGVPNEIHIELARKLKASKREKLVSAKRKRERERANRSNADTAAEGLHCSPDEISRKLLLKMALGEEQGWHDPYTDESIVMETVIADDSYSQVDHILPLSRTCDDSRSNKVLVLNKSNQDKGQRTPYEWMTSGEATAPDWESFRARVLELCPDSRKRAHLLEECLDSKREDGFIGRNLSDTRYMSRLFKDWLEETLAWPDDSQGVHVVALAGGATAALRHAWGLNLGQNNTKDRSDDRHHAVDAAVIAACSRATVSAVARMRSRDPRSSQRVRDSRLLGTQPWAGFAEEVLAAEQRIVPTRAVSHGLSGCLYKDTLYHFEGYDDRGYPLLKTRTMGEPKAMGNVRIFDDGSARDVSSLAFVRLWLDASARKGRGKWLLEPVYYADLPEALDVSSYVPLACKSHTPRNLWDAVPGSARIAGPTIVYPGDVLVVGGHIARFFSININGCKLQTRSVLVNDPKAPFARDFPTLGKWDASTTVRVFNQDCLGHCWHDIQVSSENTEFAMS